MEAKDCLLNNPRLDFDMFSNVETGELKSNEANYKGLKIQLYPSGLIRVSGSFHKFYNNGLHNYDDFTFSKMKQVLSLIELELGFSLLRASINNLEFGVNVNTSFNPNELINDLLCFKWKQFDTMNIKGHGMGKQCKAFNQYIVKIYNKSLQYGLPENILRVEKKVITMLAMKVGKLRVSDLQNPNLWEHCKYSLIEMLDDILINEPINENLLKKTSKRIYNTVVCQRSWSSLDRYKKGRYKKQFNKLIDSFGSQQYKSELMRHINERLEYLINT